MHDNLNRRKKKKITNRFLEHLRGVEKGGKDASKPVARHFNNSTSNTRETQKAVKTASENFCQNGALNHQGTLHDRISFN